MVPAARPYPASVPVAANHRHRGGAAQAADVLAHEVAARQLGILHEARHLQRCAGGPWSKAETGTFHETCKKILENDHSDLKDF